MTLKKFSCAIIAAVGVIATMSPINAAQKSNAGWESTRKGFYAQCSKLVHQGGANVSRDMTGGALDGTVSDEATRLAGNLCPCIFNLSKRNMTLREWQMVYPMGQSDKTPEMKAASKKFITYLSICSNRLGID